MTTQAPDSPVDICNLALQHIGEAKIATIEAPTNHREETMALWYDHVRRVVLREQLWNFAQSYREIPRSGDGIGTYADAYNLPNDFIRLNSVGLDRNYPCEYYDMGDGKIYANKGSSLHIYYNSDVRQVSKMDPLFIQIFAIRLAIMVAYTFTKKKSVTEGLMALLKTEEPKATSVDGQERKPRRIQRSKYLDARRYGGSLGRNTQYYDTGD